MSTHLSKLLIFLTEISLANAILRNVTIDDAATSVVIPYYFPSPSDWIQGADCPGCGAHPDPVMAVGGTWHDTTFHPGDAHARAIELSFSGSAVYVFFILANTIQSGLVDTVTNMNFIIDGVLVGNFIHNPSTSTEFIYDVPVYVNESLLSREHQLRMEATGDRPVLILFDYLIYTIDEAEATSTISLLTAVASASTFVSTSAPVDSETPAQSSKSQNGAIIGGAVAGALALSLLSGTLLYCRHRKRERKTSHDGVVTQVTNNDRGPLFRSTDRSVDIVPFTSGSNSRIEAPSAHATMSFTSKTHAVNSNLRPSTAPHSKSHIRREMASDLETHGRSRMDLAGNPPSSNKNISVPQRPDAWPTDEARGIRGEVERLRDEVARLRQLHQQQSEELPRYS